MPFFGGNPAAGEWTLIEIKQPSGSNNFTFSSVPAYRMYRITARFTTATDDDYLKMQFNADTGAHYLNSYILGVGAVISGGLGSTDGIDLGRGRNATSEGAMEIIIGNNAAGVNKGVNVSNMNYGRNFIGAGNWNNTAALISAIKILTTGPSNFGTASEFILEGAN